MADQQLPISPESQATLRSFSDCIQCLNRKLALLAIFLFTSRGLTTFCIVPSSLIPIKIEIVQTNQVKENSNSLFNHFASLLKKCFLAFKRTLTPMHFVSFFQNGLKVLPLFRVIIGILLLRKLYCHRDPPDLPQHSQEDQPIPKNVPL